MVDRHRHQRLAYDFLIDHAKSQATFTMEDLEAASEWTPITVDTYISKHLQEFIEKLGPRSPRGKRQHRVHHEFTGKSLDDFLNLATQKRRVYSTYQRVRYHNLICFEFLLPLTREDELRSALDALFFRDTIVQRLLEIGLAKVGQIVERPPEVSDKQFIEQVCNIVSKKFGGYSISYVNGRFRVGELLTRSEAGRLMATGDRYLIDENTAIVRFMIPCHTTRAEYDADFASISRAISDSYQNGVRDEVSEEADVIRLLFFHLFVEAVVRTVHGEAEIWLVETGLAPRLYVWEKLGT